MSLFQSFQDTKDGQGFIPLVSSTRNATAT